MSAVKGFLDLAMDFIMFIAACAFIIGGFASTASVQNALNSTLIDKGSVITTDVFENTYILGEEVIALLLLPDGIKSVIIDGITFSSGIEKSVNYIDPGKKYEIIRESIDGSIRLRITSIVE